MTSPSRSETARFCAGVAAVRARAAVVALLVVEAISRVAFAAFPVIFIVVVSDELSGDGTDIGLIRGTSAFGGIVAALVIARRASRFPPARLLFAGGLAPATLAKAPSLSEVYGIAIYMS